MSYFGSYKTFISVLAVVKKSSVKLNIAVKIISFR